MASNAPDASGLVERLGDEPWVIIKRGLFYRPDNCGYTGIRDYAGHYSEDEAKATADGDGVTCMKLSDAPEYSSACFSDLKEQHLQGRITTLTARVAEQDAEIARLSWDRGQMWETLTYVRYASDCEVTRNAAAETLDEISALEAKP
jgi:hypothetical protein